MPKYLHESVLPNNQITTAKTQQVATMFNSIAKRYDFLNRFLSFGIDISWRKKTINQLKAINPKYILDVATGTADVAILTNKILNPRQITGIDISESMLQVGKEKIVKQGLQNTIELQLGNCEKLNFADNTFDAVTVAYGVRNFQNLEQGLSEILRVLKVGGKLSILEASKPTNKIVQYFYNLYMVKIMPKFGGIVSGNKEAYLYLNNSVQAFPEGNAFLNILNEVGFTKTYLQKLSLGVCTIYCGSKQ